LIRLVVMSVFMTALGSLPALAAGTFIDDDGNPHESNIEVIAAAGITEGCNPTGDRYCPGDPVTRGQMAAFLNRAFQLPASSADAFDDDDGSIFEADINAVAAAGITTGCASRQFCESGLVTREEMAAFLSRALALPPASGNRFADDDSSPFESEIESLAAAGITRGCTATTFCPLLLVLRDQMASFLARSISPPSSSAECTMVIGFSQTQDWYRAGTFEQILPDGEWELLGQGGGAIQLWADPAYEGWSSMIYSPCTTGEPDRAILTITGQGRSVAQWMVDIEEAALTTRSKFPSVAEVLLQPVVGGPDHAICEFGGETVRAAQNHPLIDDAIAQVVSSSNWMRAGFSPEVRTCTDYGDSIGHLVDSANGPVGAEIATFYLNFG
jgi:hypothetical protein